MLSAEFNRRILKLAPKFQAKDLAPDTYPDLVKASTSGLVVWAGASYQTVYGDARVNHAFRAWHDSLHLKLDADFSLEGEIRVSSEQARVLGGSFGDIIMAEVAGQVEYFRKHGCFPLDQVAFAIEYLKRQK